MRNAASVARMVSGARRLQSMPGPGHMNHHDAPTAARVRIAVDRSRIGNRGRAKD
jgi:hypothetical protein